MERKVPINTGAGLVEDDETMIKIRAEQRRKEKAIESKILEQIEVSLFKRKTTRCGSVSSNLCAACSWLKRT